MNGTHRATVTTSRDEAEIRRLMVEQEAGMKAHDAERLVARYAPDAVVFDLAPPLAYRAPELLDPDGVRNWFAGFERSVDYEIRDLTVTAGEDVAFCHSLHRLSATPRGTTDRFDLWFRVTTGMRKVDGAWRVTHEHKSTPFYMDGSFKAAIDLRP
jgi:ketosteroid isomerase-like protein